MELTVYQQFVCVRRTKVRFVSSIIREPLHGENAVCPVSTELRLWLSGPNTVINNFIHALSLPSLPLRSWHVINLRKMRSANAFRFGCYQRWHQILSYVKTEFDENINNIVAGWPAEIDNTLSLKLGFSVDKNFNQVIQQFIQHDMWAE